MFFLIDREKESDQLAIRRLNPFLSVTSVPRIPWAFAMAEACGVILCNIWLVVLLLHKHR